MIPTVYSLHLKLEKAWSWPSPPSPHPPCKSGNNHTLGVLRDGFGVHQLRTLSSELLSEELPTTSAFFARNANTVCQGLFPPGFGTSFSSENLCEFFFENLGQTLKISARERPRATGRNLLKIWTKPLRGEKIFETKRQAPFGSGWRCRQIGPKEEREGKFRPRTSLEFCQRQASMIMCCQRGKAKGDRSFFLFWSPFGNQFVPLFTLFVTFCPILFCLPPFAAGWKKKDSCFRNLVGPSGRQLSDTARNLPLKYVEDSARKRVSRNARFDNVNLGARQWVFQTGFWKYKKSNPPQPFPPSPTPSPTLPQPSQTSFSNPPPHCKITKTPFEKKPLTFPRVKKECCAQHLWYVCFCPEIPFFSTFESLHLEFGAIKSSNCTCRIFLKIQREIIFCNCILLKEQNEEAATVTQIDSKYPLKLQL